MFGLDRWGGFQVGDGAGHLQDSVVGAGGHAVLGHGAFQQAFAVGGKLAEGSNMAGSHLGVAVNLASVKKRTFAAGFLLARITRSRILAELSGSLPALSSL